MSINSMKARIKYYGGGTQLERMNADKLRSLKKALLYSYQAATAKLLDGREFRCLINPDKLSLDLDNKIISIPFKDICLNSGHIDIPSNESLEGKWEDMEDLIATLILQDQNNFDDWENMEEGEDIENLPTPDNPILGEEEYTNIKEGDIICWKENGSHWIVYSRRLEETAYFRANIRRCRYQLTLGNGSKYWVYVRGPVEQSILWTQTSGNYFNKLNYSLIMYVTQNEETLKYFHRFKKVMINNQPWEVQTVDSISTPGIIEISLKETYTNTIKDDINKAVEQAVNKNQIPQNDEIIVPYILGKEKTYPYDICTYTLKNYEQADGEWMILSSSKKNIIKILSLTNTEIKLQINTGKTGNFILAYQVKDNVIAKIKIEIDSL